MPTEVPFEAGDCLIFRPKADRWVDYTQCDYGGLNKFQDPEFCHILTINT